MTGISDRLSVQIGLQRGDVIAGINRTRMRSADDVQRAFEILAGSGRVQLYVERSGDYILRTFNWSR